MLTVYTRHYSPCLQHDSLAHDCECPKWIRGVLPAHGRIRVSARTRSLQEAEDRLRKMEQTDAFEISSVEQAIKLYVADARSAIQGYERSFRKLFRIADIRHSDGPPKRCHAHMFRDTFAVELLLAAVPVDQVSMLLGHRSVRMTEKHYLPWVQARQKQLTRSIRRAWFREVKFPGFSSAQTQPRQISTPTHTPHSFADS